MADSCEMTVEEALELTPLTEFARKVDRSRDTLRRWHDKGCWNISRTKLVRLTLRWMPNGGWGCTDEMYRQFMQELNEE